MALLELLFAPQGPQSPDHELHGLAGNAPALHLLHHTRSFVPVVQDPLRAEDVPDGLDYPVGLSRGYRGCCVVLRRSFVPNQ